MRCTRVYECQIPVFLIATVTLVHFLIIPNSLIKLLRLHVTLGSSEDEDEKEKQFHAIALLTSREP